MAYFKPIGQFRDKLKSGHIKPRWATVKLFQNETDPTGQLEEELGYRRQGVSTVEQCCINSIRVSARSLK